jgi:signal transduction histidine kinase
LGEIIDAYMRQSEELKIALDKAKESDRLKSAFLSNMSHEIRTPLNGIIGFSQLVCRPNISDEKRASFQKTIARCGEDLIKIISDILDISKIELRQIKITPTWFSVFELFEELETFYPIILADHQKEHLKIIFITPAHDTNIFLDKAKIKQSLINLITNAIKYTNEGSIEVSFRIKERVIIFEVKDTGPGIRPEDQKMLFQLFSQIKNDNTKLHGAGLGLAIAKGLTSLQNGTIKFKSEMGKGTTFRISIPLNLAKKIKKQEIN